MDAKTILLENQDLFSDFSNMLLYILRGLGWLIIRGFAWLNSQLETSLYAIFNATNIFMDKKLGLGGGRPTGIYASLLPVAKVLLVLGIMIVGFKLMTGRIEQRSKIVSNLIIVMIAVFGMPTILSSLASIAIPAVNAFKTESGFMETLIMENVLDLKYIDSQNFSKESIKKKNNFSASKSVIPVSRMIDATETIDPKDANNQDVFKNKLDIADDGTVTLKEVAKKGLFNWSMFETYRYRYKINWFPLSVAMLALFIALIVVCVKTAKNIFNLNFAAFLALFASPLDISTGQRTKKILEEIVLMFAMMVLTMFSLYLYITSMTIAANKVSGLPSVLLQLGFSMAVIGGPAVVQRVLGIDAGVGKELQSAASTVFMAKTAGDAIKGGAKMVGDAFSAVGKGAAAAGTAGAALAGGAKSTFDNASKHYGDKFGRKDPTAADFSVLGPEGRKPGSEPRIGKGDDMPMLGTGNEDYGSKSAASSPDEPMPPTDGGADTNPDIGANTDIGSDIGGGDMDSSGSGVSMQDDSPPPSSGPAGSASDSGNPDVSNSKDIPDSNRINKDDTIASAFRKAASNSKGAKDARSYADKLDTAFNIGRNTVDKGWDNYRNQDPIVPYVQAEGVDSKESVRKKSKPEDIVVDMDEAMTTRTQPDKEKPFSGGGMHTGRTGISRPQTHAQRLKGRKDNDNE